MRVFKIVALTTVCIVLGIILAWQFTSVKKNQVLAQYEKKNTSQIIEELLAEKSNNDKLRARISMLQKEVDGFKTSKSGESELVKQLKDEMLKARIMAGLETVKGEGLIITVQSGGDREIEDRHIEDLINELKASDVQAVCVNEERIVSLSEIRNAGDYIMINGRQLVPPYTIKAIGDPTRMDRALNILRGLVEKFDYFEFEIDIKQEKNVIIPGVRDDGTVLRFNMLTPVEQ